VEKWVFGQPQENEKSKKYGEIGQLVIITISEYCNINIVAAKQGLNDVKAI
jgi:hypothetical protein